MWYDLESVDTNIETIKVMHWRNFNAIQNLLAVKKYATHGFFQWNPTVSGSSKLSLLLPRQFSLSYMPGNLIDIEIVVVGTTPKVYRKWRLNLNQNSAQSRSDIKPRSKNWKLNKKIQMITKNKISNSWHCKMEKKWKLRRE